MSDIEKTNKYRKAYYEYRSILYEELKKNNVNFKDYESYQTLASDISRNFKIKNVVAKKYNIKNVQIVANWVSRKEWNDLSNFVNIPKILSNSRLSNEIKSNSPYGPELLDKLKIYSGHLNTSGEPKYNKKELAEILNISEAAFYKYMKKAEFREIFEETRKKAIRTFKYEAALDKKAFGHTLKEIVSDMKRDEDGDLIVIREREIQKEVAGDTKAITFGLTNLAPEKYSDKQEKKQDITITSKIDLSNLSDEELEKIVNGQ